MPDVDELLRGAQDSIAAKRVYGEPVERDGTTVIPAASVRGGGGHVLLREPDRAEHAR